LILEYKEEIASDFKGTIIDIETIGEFNGRYRNTGDWREYEGIQQVIFGLINSQHLQILWVKKKEEITELNDRISSIIDKLEKPFMPLTCPLRKVFLPVNWADRLPSNVNYKPKNSRLNTALFGSCEFLLTAIRLMTKACSACMPGRTANSIKRLPTTVLA